MLKDPKQAIGYASPQGAQAIPVSEDSLGAYHPDVEGMLWDTRQTLRLLQGTMGRTKYVGELAEQSRQDLLVRRTPV